MNDGCAGDDNDRDGGGGGNDDCDGELNYKV